MSSTSRRAARAGLVALTFFAAACGGSDATDPEAEGQQAQAVAQLTATGLTADQAQCMVREMGADLVVEAPDVAVLADGQPYKDAAEACLK